MFEFKVPLSLKIGPGVNTFGLAVKRSLFFRVNEINDSEMFSIDLNIETEFLNRKELLCLLEKLKRYFLKEYSDLKKSFSVSVYSDESFPLFLNVDVSFIVGILIAFFKVVCGQCDQDRLLRTFKKISPDVECACAVLLGGLGIVDREKKSFLSIDWPSKWKISVIKCSDEKVCKYEKINSKDEYFIDSVSKAAVFISALYSKHSDMLFSSFQDNISYAMNRGGIPFLEKIKLIGKTANVAGLGFLKNDCGLMVTGEQKKVADCIERIEIIYSRNNVMYSTFLLDSQNNGVVYE
jgi:homoserine kinase